VDQGIAEVGVDRRTARGEDRWMTAALVAAMLAVLGHHAWRAVRSGGSCRERHTAVSVWHALMAAGMAAMLALALPPLLAAAAAVLFAAGALWAGGAALHTRPAGSGRRALHVRLAVACAAMVVMLWSGAASAVAAVSTPAVAPSALAAGSHHGSVAAVAHDHAALVGSATGTWLTAAALLAVLVVAALSTRRVVTPGVAESRVESRADACCEAVMALVAAGMLAAPLLAAVA
jgi:hypothetical protein